MKEPPGDFLQSKEKQNNPHRSRAIIIPHGSALVETQKLTQGPLSHSKPNLRCRNTKERLDSKAKSMLSSYLDQMVARRGSLEVQSAQPKQISLDFLSPDFMRGPQLAQDEESKVLGDSLHDFFNMAPDTPSPKRDNEKIQKKSQDMMDGWMTAWKAGKDCTSLPEAPTKQKIKQEANVNPATTFFDDLRIPIDLVAESPTERTPDTTFKPAITRSWNDKATLDVILKPAPHAECEENQANVASLARGIDNQPCTPLATKRSQISRCQGASQQYPTTSCSRESTLTASSLAEIKEFINTPTPVNVKISHSEQGSDTAVYPSAGEKHSEDFALASSVLPDNVDSKLSTSTSSELQTQEGTLEDRPATSSSVTTLQKDHSDLPNDDWFDASFFESPKHGVVFKRSLTPTGATAEPKSNMIKVNVNGHVSHKPRFKRFPTAEEIAEEIIDPTAYARILKACGASQEYIDANPVDLQEEAAIRLAFSQKYLHSNVPYDEILKRRIYGQPKLQNVVIRENPVEGEKKIIRQIQKIRAEQRQTLSAGQEAERQKSRIKIETTSPTYIKQESPEENSIERFTLKDTSDATIQQLIRTEDQAKITKVTRWCSSQTALHFKTLSNRKSVSDTLPDSVKALSTDPSQVHITVFPPRLVKLATTISLDRYSSKGTCRASPPEMLEPLYANESIPADCLFPQFGKLNKIIRRMIFGLARPASRFIKLGVCVSTRSIYSTASVPSLLHACKDSRELALSWYKLSFSNPECPFPKVYFDFSRDGIYTRCRGCIGANCRHKKTLTKEHENVKLIVFEAPMSFKPFRKIARFYPAIEHLILIKGKSRIARGEISWEEFDGVSERLFWQGKEEDLLRLYKDLLKDNEPRLAGESKLRIVERKTLPGVVDSAEQASAGGEGMWSCCR